MRDMIVFCPVWGEKNLDLLENCLGRSLLRPLNKKAIDKAHWIVITDTQESGDRATRFIRSHFDSSVEVRVEARLLLKGESNHYRFVLLESLRQISRECLASNTPMLMATCDFYFGEGTIAAFQKVGSDPGSCVSIPNMRVLPSFLKRVAGNALSNPELIEVALDHAHDSWKYSEKSMGREGMTFIGGISWERIDQRVTAVRHYLPSPFYVNFSDVDVEFFNDPAATMMKYCGSSLTGGPPHFGVWDHVWTSLIISYERLRYIGSSDAALLLEVTDADLNVPDPNPEGKTNRDRFRGSGLHTAVQSQFIYSLRNA